MTKDEVLDLALEALTSGDGWRQSDAITAITAIKQARSAPVPEPVAWTVSGKITDWSKDFSAYQTKHYTRPVYTPPAAQRQWVGLKPGEAEALYNQFAKYQEEGPDVSGWWAFADAIEAQLKELNT